MNRKWLSFPLLIALGAAVISLQACKNNTGPGSVTKTSDKQENSSRGKIDRNRGFDRRTSFLEYSHHARCRMECRHISQAEVEDVMRNGKINYYKSDLQNDRCPRYALEGITQDGQRVRIIFAQCNEKTEVVTVIDLETEWKCDCPGDDLKYKNRN